MTGATVLNLILFLPLIAAVLLALVPREQQELIRTGAIGVAAVTFFVSLGLLPEFRVDDNASFQFLTTAPWIPQFGVQYKVGVDGISLMLVLLTTLLTVIAMIASWESIQERVKEYYIFLLLLETGMLGVFVSLDLILFYVFWEVMLIPMYFLIGIWGGPRKLYATIKFVLYTLVGSLLMLVGIIWIYVGSTQSGGPGTFDLVALTDPRGPLAESNVFNPQTRLWLFLAFAAAFAIKVPMWPFHTWLPDAHVEAPTAGSVILAGVLLKMGTYGFLRFCIPLFPDVALQVAPWILGLSVVGIIYGALVAFVQEDVKRLVAYSSVSHLGFCMLGLFAFTREGVSGSVLQMLNHGLSTGALFLLVGMIYERRHTRQIDQFGGLWKVIPVYTVFMLITMLSSVGLPGLNGFVGEFLILLGTWGGPGAPTTNQWAATLGATGVILGAIYMLWMFQRVFQGPVTKPENQRLRDMSLREWVTVLPLVILMFWVGIRPNDVLRYFDQAVYRSVVEPVERVAGARGSGPAGPAHLAFPPPTHPSGGPATTTPSPGGGAHGADDGHGHGEGGAGAPGAPPAGAVPPGPGSSAPSAPATAPAPAGSAGHAGENH